jgi:hypothetical protein
MFRKIFRAIRRLLSQIFKGKDNLKENTNKVLRVVDIIKTYVNSPVADGIVEFTPTQDDNKILAELRGILNRVAVELEIVADGVVYENETELLLLLRDYLTKLSAVAQKVYLQIIAATLIKLLENELTTTEANLIISAAYYQQKNTDKTNATD